MKKTVRTFLQNKIEKVALSKLIERAKTDADYEDTAMQYIV